MRRGFFQLLEKHAAVADPAKFLEKHFSDPRWEEFRKKLRSKTFVRAVKTDDRSDSKLKRYAEMNHRHKVDKGPIFPVPSQTSGRTYTVKYHPDLDRFSCNCGDWHYTQSHKTGKNRDCKHIQMAKLELREQGIPKRELRKMAMTAAAARLLEELGKG